MTIHLSEIYSLTSQNNPDWNTQLPDRLTVGILLSSTRHVKTTLERLRQYIPEMDSEVQGRNITVSFYPPSNDFDANRVLRLIRDHDSQATITSQGH